MEFSVSCDVYNRAAVLLSVQRYLAACWVTIAASSTGWTVTIRPKQPGITAPTNEQYSNALVEAAFLEQRARETLPLRHAMLAHALKSASAARAAPDQEH